MYTNHALTRLVNSSVLNHFVRRNSIKSSSFSCSFSKPLLDNNTIKRKQVMKQCVRYKGKNSITIVSQEEACRFMRDCLVAAGAAEKSATQHAIMLTEADTRGHYSHGMNRLEAYVLDIEQCMTDGTAIPVIEKETEATALVNGKNTLGAVVGLYAMNLAMKKAAKMGVGLVSCRNSNHYGIAQYYILHAVKSGFIGFTCTNTSPCMVHPRAKKAVLGTNPMGFGAPGCNGEDFIFDIATTNVALGKIEIKRREGKQIPPGWALDSDGNNSTDPTAIMKAGLLLPLGGTEETGGHKGFGLALMVETLCGILSDSDYGSNIRQWKNRTKPANLGHCFMAINPKMFADGFIPRLNDLIRIIKSLPRADPKKEILIPGDSGRLKTEKVKKDGGLSYIPDQIETCNKLAKRLKVKPLKPKSGSC